MKLHMWIACVGLVSVLSACQSDDAQTVTPADKSERGESCQARNDCVSGLACIANRCVLNEYPIAVDARECVRVDCATRDECCLDFTPTQVTEATCIQYDADCRALLDQASCDLYNRYCICNLVCEDERCVPANNCSDTIPCTSGVCNNGVCVECMVDIDCPGEGTCNVTTNHCIDHCTRNEECAQFESCVSGQCEHTGCTSDRECYFDLQNPRAECRDGECRVPCENDAECLQDFHACQGGLCVFIGCETDEECRVYFELYNVTGFERAECRAPDS